MGISYPCCDISFKATYNPYVQGNVYKEEALVKLDRALKEHIDTCHPGMNIKHNVFQPIGLVIDARLSQTVKKERSLSSAG